MTFGSHILASVVLPAVTESKVCNNAIAAFVSEWKDSFSLLFSLGALILSIYSIISSKNNSIKNRLLDNISAVINDLDEMTQELGNSVVNNLSGNLSGVSFDQSHRAVLNDFRKIDSKFSDLESLVAEKKDQIFRHRSDFHNALTSYPYPILKVDNVCSLSSIEIERVHTAVDVIHQYLHSIRLDCLKHKIKLG